MSPSLPSKVLNCETVFLDAGGVLVWPNWDRIADVLAQYEVHVTSAQLAAVDPAVRHEIDTSDELRSAPDHRRGWLYLELVLERAGVPLSDAVASALAVLKEYHQAYNLWERVPLFVRPALTQLRKQGLRLVVVSNANGTLARAFQRLELASLVDVLIDSSELGVEKPDRRLFDSALERSGARRESTVHAGDLYSVDVVGARNAGLQAVLVDEGGLYETADCLRVRSLAELPDIIVRRVPTMG